MRDAKRLKVQRADEVFAAKSHFFMKESYEYPLVDNVVLVKKGKSETPQTEESYQTIEPDFTIKIPKAVAEKLKWYVGSEVWVDVLDKELSQAVVGKRLRGDDAVSAMTKLQELMSDDNPT